MIKSKYFAIFAFTSLLLPQAPGVHADSGSKGKEAEIVTQELLPNKSTLLNHTLQSLSPKGEVNLAASYQGKIILAVNTASACGFTPQLADLEKLYKRYKDKGLVVLGFPSNDFYQERKQGDEIVEFCRLNYGVSFPLMSRSSVIGSNANSFFKDLAAAENGRAPGWNFFKYLINRQGQLVEVFPSQEKPISSNLEKAVSALL